jgi:hypothetical protein
MACWYGRSSHLMLQRSDPARARWAPSPSGSKRPKISTLAPKNPGRHSGPQPTVRRGSVLAWALAEGG